MSVASINVEQITLRRLDRKLWQHENSKPKRVELAVLDYLKSKSWEGYFTEHFDYDRTLLTMMLWCNRESFFKEKRKSLALDDPRTIFNKAADGFWRFNAHKFTHGEIISHAENFSEEMIAVILKNWKDRGIKSNAIGTSYLNPRCASELDEKSLLSFYTARGGLPFYLNFINYYYSSERQKLLNRCRILDVEMLEKHGHNYYLREFVEEAGAILAVYQSPQFTVTKDNIKTWIDKIEQQKNSKFKEELLKLGLDIFGYWNNKNNEFDDIWKKVATLDLVVWKNSVASVEVKAPNDTLKDHQREQLQIDASNGKTSWVIEVLETNEADGGI